MRIKALLTAAMAIALSSIPMAEESPSPRIKLGRKKQVQIREPQPFRRWKGARSKRK